MKILSINFGHDASLSLFEDENLLDFLEIERISRLKHHVGITSQYIKDFLLQNNIYFKDIDTVAITGTQNWPLCHTNDIKIEYKVINSHFNNFNKDYVDSILTKENYIETDKEIYTEKFSKQLQHQFITSFTPTLNRLTWSSTFLDGPNVLQENINDLLSNFLNSDKRYFNKDFYIPVTLTFEGLSKPGFYVHHHTAHALHAAKYSQKTSIIVTHDGGLNTIPFNSGGIYFYHHKIGLLPINSHNFGFGQLYDYISNYFRLTPGKLMGLASFGNPTPYIEKIENIILDIFDSEISVRSKKVEELGNTIIEISKDSKSIKTDYVNKFDFNFDDTEHAIQVAANTQAIVQQIYCRQISRIVSLIQNRCKDTKDLLLTGGFTLNCPSNTQLSVMLPSFNVKPLPACGDTGLSIGGGVGVNFLSLKKYVDKNIEFNLAAFPHSNLKNDDSYLSHLQKSDDEDLAKNIAKYLSQNKVICINRGRSEVGPRALGNRSIIAIASSSKTRDLINKAKGRENWRPLAPICCDVDFNDYFDGDSRSSQFMLFTNKVKTGLTNAVQHVDNTARVQCLYNKQDWLYQSLQLLKLWGLTPVIVNTSFNCSDEPIVENFEQSYKSFKRMNFDYLVYNNYVIEKGQEFNFQNKLIEMV